MSHIQPDLSNSHRAKKKGPQPPAGKPPLTTEKGTVCANLLDAYMTAIREDGHTDMVSFALRFGSCNFSSLTHRAEEEFKKTGERLCSKFDERWIEIFWVEPINKPLVEKEDLRGLADELIGLLSRIEAKLT